MVVAEEGLSAQGAQPLVLASPTRNSQPRDEHAARWGTSVGHTQRSFPKMHHFGFPAIPVPGIAVGSCRDAEKSNAGGQVVPVNRRTAPGQRIPQDEGERGRQTQDEKLFLCRAQRPLSPIAVPRKPLCSAGSPTPPKSPTAGLLDDSGRAMSRIGKKHARINTEILSEFTYVVLADLASPGQDVGNRRPGDARCPRHFGLRYLLGVDQMGQRFRRRWLSPGILVQFITLDQRGQNGDQFTFGTRRMRPVLFDQLLDLL